MTVEEKLNVVKYDERAKAISIRLLPSDPSRYSHSEEITDYVIIDRDIDGNATAVEILGIEGIEDYDGNEYRPNSRPGGREVK